MTAIGVDDNGSREGQKEVPSVLYQQTSETLPHLNIPADLHTELFKIKQNVKKALLT